MNYDIIQPIEVCKVDISLLEVLLDSEFSEMTELCLCSIYIKADGHAYCSSKGDLIVIGGRPIKAEQLHYAIMMLQPLLTNDDDSICGSCICKLLEEYEFSSWNCRVSKFNPRTLR